MKTIFAFILIISFVCINACSKSSSTQNESLTGKWTLSETLADPGDGSGQWTPVNSTDYIQFNADSSAESPINPFNGGVVRYQIPADSTLALFYNNGTKYTYTYYINGSALTIMGGCIEACGSRYIKR